MTTHKGIFYFKDWSAAHGFAAAHALPLNRIICYQRGWAIQLRISGPYAGPDTV